MYIAVKIRFSGMDRSELLNNNGNIILFMDAVAQIYSRFNRITATVIP